MKFEFKKAVKSQQKLRVLIEGPSGSGKTYSALEMATGIGGKIVVIDTENGSASLYSDYFNFDTVSFSGPFSPENYIEAITSAEQAGYDIVIIDSITHEWSGQGGCLDIQEKLGGQYRDWAKVTPRHNKFLENILKSTIHIIATARTKHDIIVEQNEKGKSAPRKVGLKTEQRDGLDYEFTTVLRLNQSHMFECSKDRTRIFEGRTEIVTKKLGSELVEWLSSGVKLEEVDEPKEYILKSEVLESKFDQYKTSLLESSTLEELKSAWELVPKDRQNELFSIKESMKSGFIG